MSDPLIGEQGIIFRDYIPLEDFGTSVNGQPFANEWRCFFYKGELLSYGYYWVSGEVIPDKSQFEPEALAFAKLAGERVKDDCSFYVIDIAKTKEGKWIVIELNDGMMSGLSDNDPHVLYRNLKTALEKEVKKESSISYKISKFLKKILRINT